VLFVAVALFCAALIAARGTRRMRAGRSSMAFGLCAWLCASPVFAPAAQEAPNAPPVQQAAIEAASAQAPRPLAAAARHAEDAGAAGDDVRLARTFGANATLRSLVRGRVEHASSVWKNGQITTVYTVRDAAGREQRLELLGGEVDGIGQRFLHAEALPSQGDEIVVRGDEPVAKRWAYCRDGMAFGGSLGRGPAIRIQ
jgi:hypothetical protein